MKLLKPEAAFQVTKDTIADAPEWVGEIAYCLPTSHWECPRANVKGYKWGLWLIKWPNSIQVMSDEQYRACAVDAYEMLDDVLEGHEEYDAALCCNGRECGCKGESVFASIKHYFGRQLKEPRDG